MIYSEIIKGLSQNRNVFKELLFGLTEETYLWKPDPEKWCLLEIICHLYDEESEDFRTRTKHVLETPTELLPAIDPQAWVKSSLSNPMWDNAYEHSKFGKMTAKMFLSNWLAHDLLHIRQIIKLKYDNLKQLTNEDLNYAGNW